VRARRRNGEGARVAACRTVCRMSPLRPSPKISAFAVRLANEIGWTHEDKAAAPGLGPVMPII
jgi:hypothetical protein